MTQMSPGLPLSTSGRTPREVTEELIRQAGALIMSRFKGALHVEQKGRGNVVTEVDLLVELSTKVEGVLGARLTGAGFGGCTVNLVRDEALEPFQRQVVDAYRERTGLPARMHLVRAGGGLRVSDA